MKETTLQKLANEAICLLVSISNRLDELRILHEAAATEQSGQLKMAA